MKKARYTLDLHCPPVGTAALRPVVAFRIAREFPTAPPTVAALRERYGMSRASAYRWIAAWKEGMR